MTRVGSIRIKVQEKNGFPDRYVCAMVRALAFTLEGSDAVRDRSDEAFAEPDGCEFSFSNPLNVTIFEQIVHDYLLGFAWKAPRLG